MGSNGAVLVRERVKQIGREAAARVREEMKELGRAIAESKDRGFEMEKVRDEERGRRLKAHRSNTTSGRVRSV